MSRTARLIANLFGAPGRLRRWFPQTTMERIRATIERGELTHAGEICFAVESRLPLRVVLAGRSARERAADVFERLRVWDTEANSGILIYALLAERQVEILADRGIAARVDPSAWTLLCAQIAGGFRDDAPAPALLAAIESMHALLARHFPAGKDNPRELSDVPHVL